MLSKYPIPIYLNQRIVFDLLAMMEDGFSNVETIKSTLNASNNKQESGTATFGVTNVLSSLLKIDLTANKQRQFQDSNATERSFEKVYTSTSLLSRVMKRLESDKEVIVLDNALQPEEIRVGNFIDISTSLSPDPVFKSVENLTQLIRTFIGKENLLELPEGDKTLAQADAISDVFSVNNIISVIGRLRDSEYKLIIGVEPDSVLKGVELRNITGEYRVFGKVSNILSDGAIDIGSGTGFDTLKQFIPQDNLAINGLPGLITNPDEDRKITAPLVQIIPIAIYV